MADGFWRGPSARRLFARFLPVGNGFSNAARCGVVVRQQLRLSLSDLRETFLQDVAIADGTAAVCF